MHHLRVVVPGPAYSPAGRCGGLSRDDSRREEAVEETCGVAPDADVRVCGAAK